jgi:hypothetical protein
MVNPEPCERWVLKRGSPYGPVEVFILSLPDEEKVVRVDYQNYVRTIPLSDFDRKLS